jgi:hypothetical protein
MVARRCRDSLPLPLDRGRWCNAESNLTGLLPQVGLDRQPPVIVPPDAEAHGLPHDTADTERPTLISRGVVGGQTP